MPPHSHSTAGVIKLLRVSWWRQWGFCPSLGLAQCWQLRCRPWNGCDCDILGPGDALLPLAARRNCCSGRSGVAGGISALAPSQEGMPPPQAAFLAVSCHPRGPGARQS